MLNVQSNILMTKYPKILCCLFNCIIFSQLHPLRGLKITQAIARWMPRFPGGIPMWRWVTIFPHSLVHLFWAALYSCGSQGAVILKEKFILLKTEQMFHHLPSLILILCALFTLCSCSLLLIHLLSPGIFIPRYFCFLFLSSCETSLYSCFLSCHVIFSSWLLIFCFQYRKHFVCSSVIQVLLLPWPEAYVFLRNTPSKGFWLSSTLCT